MATMLVMNRPSNSSRIFLLAQRRTPSDGANGQIQRYRLARVSRSTRVLDAGRRPLGPKRI